MPVNLSIKNAPDDLVVKLKERAAKHHRSLQGELLAIIEEALRTPHRLTPKDVLAEIRRLGLRTSADAAAIVRANRDGR
jgi:plasmid stability protein